MANGRPRGSSIFSGLMLILVGALLLLHNYGGFELSRVLFHWWPVLLIFWGAIKLYERTAGTRSGEPGGARVTSGEVFLVIGLLALVAAVAGVDMAKNKIGDDWGIDLGRENFSSDLDVAPQAVPVNARITIHGGHGDISVRSSDEPEIRVNGKKSVRGWNESEAQRAARGVSVEIVKNGDGYEVRPSGVNGGDSRISVDMDVVVPSKSSVTVRNDKGDISVADMARPVTINGLNGDIEVRNTTGDVSIDMRRGDAKVSGTKGDVKISGHGDSIEVVDATGNFTINGEFVGPIRAEKVAKGVRFVSQRTDLTLTQLSGHMEVGSGNLEVVDAPGNLNVRTHEEEVSIENAGGKIKVDNRNGNVAVRFSFPPKEDIEIYNASARITLGLPESANFEIQADCHSGDIDSEFEADSLKKTSSGSGDSHLEGKYGNGRGPKIILKTSYGSISIHKNS
jgi:ribosomal protein L6P/L9E